MKKTTSLLSSLALVATLLIANPGLARMNGNQPNSGSNWNNGGNYQMEDVDHNQYNPQMEGNWQMGSNTPQMGNGPQMGDTGSMNGWENPDTDMTPEQQAAALAIENGYADCFAENNHETRARVEEMILLMADDQTTLAQVNSLRAELYLLKQERRQLQNDMNQEVSDQIGTSYHSNDTDGHSGYGQPGMTDDKHTYPSGLWSADDRLMN